MTALTREQLGWRLVPIWKPAKGQVVTQAIILCCVCQKIVSTCMGPRENAYCMDCVKDEPQKEQS